ncbi:DUF2487 family protein [Paenibacillus sp. Marseille-Q4541]|uniref:DUF2487 family protein n=1 Tax=Paenibacillus sp. Marseille-Q4541 TaxID=2831522 RepID=UPI001BAA3445|nr:DUF2487 family protein [Paenibacillus sp. Marseille-Q4541]
MKFSEITSEDWGDLQPYLDTCLIPFTGLTGQESPYDTVSALERLRDLLDYVEIPFKGRIVTYPAFHYSQSQNENAINDLCSRIKTGGFKYVIVMTADEPLANTQIPQADLVFSLPFLSSERGELTRENASEFREYIHSQVYQMWL